LVSLLNVGHVEDDRLVNVAPYSLVDTCFAEVLEKPAASNVSADVMNTYRGADKSLTRPGRKQANVSVGMA